MTKILFLILTTFLLVGCGGGNSSSSNTPDFPSTVPAQNTGQVEIASALAYLVYPGDKVVKNSDDAIVRITHTNLKPESYVELVQGSASIIYNH